MIMCGVGSETGGGGGGGGEKTKPQKTKPQPSSPPPGHPEYNKTAGSKPKPTTTPTESNGGGNYKLRL